MADVADAGPLQWSKQLPVHTKGGEGHPSAAVHDISANGNKLSDWEPQACLPGGPGGEETQIFNLI